MKPQCTNNNKKTVKTIVNSHKHNNQCLNSNNKIITIVGYLHQELFNKTETYKLTHHKLTNTKRT